MERADLLGLEQELLEIHTLGHSCLKAYPQPDPGLLQHSPTHFA